VENTMICDECGMVVKVGLAGHHNLAQHIKFKCTGPDTSRKIDAMFGRKPTAQLVARTVTTPPPVNRFPNCSFHWLLIRRRPLECIQLQLIFCSLVFVKKLIRFHTTIPGQRTIIYYRFLRQIQTRGRENFILQDNARGRED
jgi:hypothetical protein